MKGRRADVIMVEGNPTEDICRTLDISGIWRGGVALNMGINGQWYPAYDLPISEVRDIEIQLTW
jgi:hypothetical protein